MGKSEKRCRRGHREKRGCRVRERGKEHEGERRNMGERGHGREKKKKKKRQEGGMAMGLWENGREKLPYSPIDRDGELP